MSMAFFRRFLTGTLACAVLCVPAAASAEVNPSIGLGIGTSGYTFSLGIPGDHFGGTLQYGSLNYNTTINSSDNSYNGQLQLHSFAVMGDYHPFVSTFTLSAGFLFPNFSLAAQAIPNADGSFRINNITYTGIQSLGGTITWSKTAPYFGIGWKPTGDQRGLAFTGGIGVALIGSPQVHINATGPGTSNPLVQAGIVAEQQSLQQATNFKVYPILNVGLLYHFGIHNAQQEPEHPRKQTQPPENGNEFPPN
jgi:hypothetical protein